ncbi:hypothetical protein RUM43_005223 [Polyplax serrata]|uniref:Sodium channel protein n=1 Tax=Polyplax serrata TaxID=468196 RepID=A0AAN8SBR6_POLSC
MTEPVEEAEFVFLAIYTAETIIKSIAKGFILNKYTYLRNPWNWLDFVVITSGYATIGMEVGNLAGLRTFRVLRALKTVSIMPGLKTIINALLHSFRQLAEVMTLTIFCLMVFALFALQVYMGELRNKCIKLEGDNITGSAWLKSVWNEDNWLRNEDYSPVICGNATGARHCPIGYVCLRVGENPNYGFTNFDNFLWSMLTTFQLITLDYWENVYNMVISACGPVSVVFFTVVVFFGSFYLINLMLAVVALSYEEEAEITQEERRKDLVDHRDDSTFSFDPSKLDVKQLDKKQKKRIDSKKGVLLSSYARKKTKRRKGRTKEGATDFNGDKMERRSTAGMGSRPTFLTIAKPSTPVQEQPSRPEDRQSLAVVSGSGLPKQEHFKAINVRESSLDDSGVVDDHDECDLDDSSALQSRKTESVTIAVRTKEKEIRILKCNGVNPGQDPRKILREHLYSLPPDYLSHIVVLDDLIDRNCKTCITCCVDYDGWLRFQNCLYRLVRDPLFELLITVCIVLNTMFLAMEHHGMSESVRQALDIGNKIFTSIFTFECFLKLLALSKEFFACGWNIFDLIIVSASLLDLSIEILDGLTVLRGLRLLRVLKLAQSWTTMKVLLSIIISTIGALGNLTFVLVIVIYIFAVIGMQLFSRDYTLEKFSPDPVPRWNFNDFFHSFMMIFRILCGEWIEPLWDCMRAETLEGGTKTCFFIFLPALVMGNFMVLNLFLALLLNSFNSEELKNKKEEVGEESKLTRSFERIRSIVKKNKVKKQKGTLKLEGTVQRMIQKQMVALEETDLGWEKLERLGISYARGTSDTQGSPASSKTLDPANTDTLYKIENEVFTLKHLSAPVSPDLSDQLQEILNERIRSLHSSRDDILVSDASFLDKEPCTDGNSPELSRSARDLVTATSLGLSSKHPTSPKEQFNFELVSQSCTNQLTFISPINSNSCSSQDINLRSLNENVLNSTCFSSEHALNKSIFNTRNVDEGLTADEWSDDKGHLSRNEGFSSASNSERTISSIAAIGGFSINEGNTTKSEPGPIHSPPSRSSASVSAFDKRDSTSISRPTVSNIGLSPSKNDAPGPNLLSHGQCESSANGNLTLSRELLCETSVNVTANKRKDTKKDETADQDVTDRNDDEERCKEKKHMSVVEEEKRSSLSKGEKFKFIRDKRLSYFLAIEQGDRGPEGCSPVACNERKENKNTGREKEGTITKKKDRSIFAAEGSKRPWHTLVSYVDELTVGRRKNSQGHFIDDNGKFPGFGRGRKSNDPQDCFPRHCYQRSVCCSHFMKTNLGRKWANCRRSVLSVVDTPAFEWIILVLIFSSSITLCFEDIYLDNNKVLKNILYWTNFGFCALFSIEMLLKWIALGFWRYFTSFWTILDFIIVFVSIFSLLIEENENLKVLRSLRTLRALRPLRAISRWQGMRIVVNALMYAIPSIFNVLLVCLVFWLIFSIMGVQFFGGKFFKCIDEDGELLPISVVNDKFECLYKNYTWINSKITFDHVGQAYLALFQVATFEGWMEVMADAVDARGEDLQPQREANLYAYLYFVIFIVCGSFFTLNLFIGVIIDNFNMLKKKYEGGVLEMFLTESQKHYYTAMKKLGRKKPQKVIRRPLNQFLAMFYDLSNSRRFEIAIFILIFLNMVTMAIEHYDQPHAIFFVLEVSNAFFTTVFGLEALVKIVGLRHHYFTVPWNVFDFLLVLASILGILMEDIMIDFPVSPTLLRVVRVFRIGRILRLIKAAKGIRKLLFALVVSLPALFNIGALLSLITFIYAIIGMSIFGHVKQQGALDDIVNFETFGRSMQLLFRLMTSAGWNDVLESLMIQPPDCNPQTHPSPNGDCGYPLLAITYFTSFIIINYMIVINMYIAIILENFNQAHQEEEIGIVEDDLEMFYIRWSKYDPHATQFIRFNQLSDFIASLDPPLGISKPNVVALVSFNLPIARGNKIHCLDILHALVKHVLGHVEETDDFKKLQDQMDVKFKKQFPTRKELEIVSSTRIWKKQDKAARIIQKTYLDYVKRRREREREAMDLEDEVTQTSSPGGWQGRLSAFLHVHRGSRASSRKSSRASDASDLSELGGPWLNLPLLLIGGTQVTHEREDHEVSPSQLAVLFSTWDTQTDDNFQMRGDICITVSEPSPDNPREYDPEDKRILSLSPPNFLTPQPLSRRRSFSILPRRGSAKERGAALHTPELLRRRSARERPTRFKESPPVLREKRKSFKATQKQGTNETISILAEQVASSKINILLTKPAAPVPSAAAENSESPPALQSAAPVPPTEPSTSNLSSSPSMEITEKRRAAFRNGSDSTIVHVLVHRESEENNVDEKGS